jgi:hypothetical protein
MQFRFHLAPKRKTPHAKKCVGAYANVWVDFPYADLAEVMVRHALRADGWRIRRLEASGPTTRAQARKDGSARYFDEAKRRGISLLIHGYRAE